MIINIDDDFGNLLVDSLDKSINLLKISLDQSKLKSIKRS